VSSEQQHPDAPEHEHPLARAYERMLERVRHGLEDTEARLEHALEAAREKAVELGELTREEAERVAGWVRRDLHEAARHAAGTGEDLARWLRFDLELIEARLWELFSAAADRTRLELMALEEAAGAPPPYRTGEVAGPGTLVCRGCGERLRFRRAGRIPPCPRCRGTEFERPRA